MSPTTLSTANCQQKILVHCLLLCSPFMAAIASCIPVATAESSAAPCRSLCRPAPARAEDRGLSAGGATRDGTPLAQPVVRPAVRPRGRRRLGPPVPPPPPSAAATSSHHAKLLPAFHHSQLFPVLHHSEVLRSHPRRRHTPLLCSQAAVAARPSSAPAMAPRPSSALRQRWPRDPPPLPAMATRR
jgi:hypothetical protein